MRNNTLALYRNGLDGRDFPLTIVPWVISGLGISVGLMGTPDTWALILLGISLTLLFTVTYGYNTSAFRSMSRTQRDLYDTNRRLPKELATQVGLNVRDIINMDNQEANILEVKLDRLLEDHSALVLEKNKYSGPAYIAGERTEALMSKVREDLAITREVNKEMEELR